MTQPISTQFFSLATVRETVDSCYEWIEIHSISAIAFPIIFLMSCHFAQSVALITGVVTLLAGSIVVFGLMHHENQNNEMREEIDQLRQELSARTEESNYLSTRELRNYVYQDFQTVQDNFTRLQMMLSERLPHAFMSFARIIWVKRIQKALRILFTGFAEQLLLAS